MPFVVCSPASRDVSARLAQGGRALIATGLAVIALNAGAASGQQAAGELEGGRFKPTPISVREVPTQRMILRSVPRAPVQPKAPGEGGGSGGNGGGPGPRGDCTDVVNTHTDANFGGGSFVVQGGFAQMEVAAAQYTIPAAAFPIKLNLAEMIFATSGSTQQTTTEWGIRVWSGRPDNGTLVASYDSDDLILPHIVIPPGTNGVNVQVSVDPGDPDQIIIDAPADGSNSFTVGYRINMHNQQTQNPCFTSPPTCCNAFPTTDTSGLQQPANNWLFGVNCGSFGCPANGGWARFSALPGFCRPSGDWVIRVTWESVNCGPTAFGACCFSNGSCTVQGQAECGQMGGTYAGDNVTCVAANCPPAATGACCFANGTCDVRTQASCIQNSGTYSGNNVTCVAANCPQPAQACCFTATGGCLNLIPANCMAAGGILGGAGTNCSSHICFPMGACCLPSGSCVGPVSPANCQGQNGVFQGHNTTCGTVTCPLPTGACCFSTTFCLVLSSGDCSTGGGSYQGDGSVCEPSPCVQSSGACCQGSTCVVVANSGLCSGTFTSFAGAGTTCSPPSNTVPCCRADHNRSGGISSQDIFDFLASFFSNSPSADINHGTNPPAAPTSQDIFDFLAAFFSGGC